MKILVIGSNSFSGFNFVKFCLNKNLKVWSVSRSKLINNYYANWEQEKCKFNFKKIDLNKNYIELFKIIDKEQFQFIANFSAQGMVAQSWKNPLDWYETNVISQIRLFEFLKTKKFLKKYLHVSTPEVYGSIKSLHNESYNFNPSTPYAISRSCADSHLLGIYKNYGFPVVFTRAANVYGPGQQLYRIIPKTIMKIRNNDKILLDGGGKSIRSFIHIDDVNSAYYKVLRRGMAGETYHVSGNEFLSVKKIVQKICNLMSAKYHKHVKELKSDRIGKDYAYKLCSNKLRIKLNWEDIIDIDNGIIDTISWINKNYNYLKKQNLEYIHKK